jgi:hypothetical protein
MKLMPFYLIIAMAFASCRSDEGTNVQENGESDGKAVIEFSSMEHDFGTIVEGEKVACVFTFQNKGDSNLLITSATTSCGCTVPDFDREPVPPGESGSVEVVFDSAYRSGAQSKTITIRSNAERPVVVLKIKAEVVTKN